MTGAPEYPRYAGIRASGSARCGRSPICCGRPSRHVAARYYGRPGNIRANDRHALSTRLSTEMAVRSPMRLRTYAVHHVPHAISDVNGGPKSASSPNGAKRFRSLRFVHPIDPKDLPGQPQGHLVRSTPIVGWQDTEGQGSADDPHRRPLARNRLDLTSPPAHRIAAESAENVPNRRFRDQRPTTFDEPTDRFPSRRIAIQRHPEASEIGRPPNRWRRGDGRSCRGAVDTSPVTFGSASGRPKDTPDRPSPAP